MKNELALTTIISTPKDLTSELAEIMGPHLVGAAKSKRAKVMADSMMACTEDLFRQIEVLEQRIEDEQKRIVQLKERITDIEEGRYKLNRDGQIIFPHLPAPHLP